LSGRGAGRSQSAGVEDGISAGVVIQRDGLNIEHILRALWQSGERQLARSIGCIRLRHDSVERQLINRVGCETRNLQAKLSRLGAGFDAEAARSGRDDARVVHGALHQILPFVRAVQDGAEHFVRVAVKDMQFTDGAERIQYRGKLLTLRTLSLAFVHIGSLECAFRISGEFADTYLVGIVAEKCGDLISRVRIQVSYGNVQRLVECISLVRDGSRDVAAGVGINASACHGSFECEMLNAGSTLREGVR
jgi:hypothetical protein